MNRTSPIRNRLPAPVVSHRAFTLVELMVITALLGILATLALAGLAVVRQRAKEDKTRSTIRKIHEVIVPHYETYVRRRVSYTPSPNKIQNARNKLVAQRLLVVREMPDNWGDVASINSGTNTTPKTSMPANPTAPMLAYARYRDSIPTLTGSYSRPECLAMIVLKGGVPPQEAESFRFDEIGDGDKDGAVEFLDAWGFPIWYVRWPPHQTQTGIDPMDPLRVSGTGVPPNNTPDPVRMPLLISGGGGHAGRPGVISQTSLEQFGLVSATTSGTSYYYPSTWVEMLNGSSPAWFQGSIGSGTTYTTSFPNFCVLWPGGIVTSTNVWLWSQVDSDVDITNLQMTDR